MEKTKTVDASIDLCDSLQDIFAHAFECVARIDHQGCYLSVNAAYAAVCGYSQDEMIGMAWQETVHPDDVELGLQKIRELLDAGRSEGEIRGLRKNRSVFYKQLLMVRGLDSDNSSVHHYCFINDITDRLLDELTVLKSVKVGLELQEQQFHALTRDIPGVVFRCNTNDYWSFSYLSAGIEKILGIPSYQLLDMGSTNYAALIHEEDRERVKQIIDSAVSKMESYVVDYRIQRKNGETRWIRERATHSKGEDGENHSIGGIIRDITDSKQSEKQFQIAQTLIDNAGDLVLWFNEEGKIIYVNNVACEVFGYERGELLELYGFDLDNNFTPTSRRAFLNTVSNFPSASIKFESTARTKDQRELKLEIVSNVVEIYGEKYSCVLAKDITAIKKNELSFNLHQTIITLLVSNTPQQEILKKICVLMEETISHSTVTLCVPSEDGCFFDFSYSPNLPGHIAESLIDIIPSEFETGNHDHEIVIIEDLLQNSFWKKKVTFQDATKFLSCWMVPFSCRRSKNTGSLTILLEHRNSPSEFELDFLTKIKNLISLTIETGEMRKHAQRFDRIIESADDLIIYVDVEYRFRAVSNRYAEGHNTSRDDMIGKYYPDIVGEELFGNSIKPYLDRGLSGEHFDFREWFVRPNMPRQYCHVKIDPVRERDNVIGVVVIIRDITQMHHMSEQLRETQDRYQSVIENSADIMIISRLADGNIKTVNKAFTEITGHEIRDVIGSKAVSYYAEPDDRKVFVDTLKQSGRCSEFETQIKTKDGRTIPVLLASNLVDYDDEQCIFTVARDISERKSAENALNEKNRSINLLQKITVAVNEASSVEHGLQICLDELCGYCDWPLGHAYILNTDSGLLESSRVWHLESAGKFAAFRRLTEETDFDKNVGLPGRILTSGKPEWIEDVSRDGNFPRNKTEEQIEVSSAFGFPVLAGDKIVAVMEFFHDLRIPRDEMLMEAAVLIGVLVGRIIERKNAEMALQQYQVNFSKAVNASPDSVIVIRLYDGAILDVNDAVVEATGYSRDELIQSGNGMMFWVSDDECKKHARQLKKKGRIANYSMLTKLKNGNTIPCLMSSTLIKVDGANCAFSIIKDISELTIVHEAIQESQKQSLLIKNTAPLSISYVDNNLRYRFTNLEFEQGFRISNESTKGKTIREVVGANKYKQLEPYISAALSGSVVKFETIITNTKGVKLVYELTYHPDKRDGVVQGVYIISSNITERKKTELTLIKTNRALRVLNECSQVLVKEENESALLQAVCDIAIREGGYHMAWVAFGSSDNSKDIISVAYSPENKDTKSFERKERSLDKRLVRKVMDTGKPYAIRNVNDMGNNFKWRDEVLRRGHMCALGLPLKSRTKTLGVLIITSTEVEAFDEEEMKLLASMAENLTYGMLAIRETGKRKKAESLLALETHAFQLLASFSTLPLFLEDLVRNIESKVEGKQCSVLLFNEGDKCLYDGASPSLDENYIKAIVGLKTGENSGPCARAAYLNKHVIVKDAYTDPLWRDYRELAIKYQVRSCSATPITTSDGRVVGTLTIYSKETGEPDHHELQICNRMAYIIGGAIDRYQIEKTLKENEERFALAMKGSQDGLWDLNLETNEVYWSPGWKKMLGYEENELKHPSLSGFLQMLHPDDQGVHERIIEEALDNFEIEFRMKHKNGHYVDILSRSTGLCTTKGGQASRIVGTHVDLTERNRSALRIKESENRFRSLYNDSPAMFMTLDEKGVVLSINKFGADHLGASVSALIDSSIFDITHKEDREGFIQKLKVCDGQSNKVQRCEIRMLHKFGDIIWVRTTMRSIELGANTKSILVTCEDITEARILSEQLEYQAKHDALTGLINRAEFEKRLRRVLNADSDDGEHALCYLDLDQFKIINDTCGHLAGDELLRRVSDILNTVVRKRDTLARMGGDEFAVLLEHCSIDQAKRVANELIHSVETLRFVWEGKRFTLGVSIGLVPMRKGSGTLTDILSAADSACYAAKDAGRNRTHVYYSDDIELSLRRGEMEWVSKINDALEDGHFCLERQTISCLNKKSKQRHGNHYEILLRMQSGDGQLVYPGAFLPAAERYNLSEKIDRWVVSKTLGWLSNNVKELESLALCTINLSGLSMGNDDFLEFLLNLFDRSIVPADKICFEITETAAIGNLGAAIQFIHALKEIGCQFALDDFGTGVSSFNYLKNLPVDYLKIDGSFIREIHKDPIDFAMVRSINEIGHVMGKETIAEFVENDAILDVVRSIGINYAQGLAIDKPVPINLKEN